MSKDEMDKWTEALRGQALTWEQTMFAASLILEAIYTEREACAKLCESEGIRIDASYLTCAEFIRARGQE